MNNPHQSLQSMALLIQSSASGFSPDSEGAEEYAARMRWADDTRKLLGEDFFSDLLGALARSCEANTTS